MWSERTSNSRVGRSSDGVVWCRTRARIGWRATGGRISLVSMRHGTTRHLVFALFAGLASPATTLAHGAAHLYLSVDKDSADRTAAHEGSAVLALESAGHGADHPALHCRGWATRSPSTVLLGPVVAVTFAPAPRVRTAIVIAPASDPPPSRLTPPDQPRAPPRG